MSGDDEWMSRGACRDADPDLFYPDENNAGRNAYARARVFCNTCPVVNDCLQFALSHMDADRNDETHIPIGAHGMWGNTSPRQRWRILGKAWAA